MCIYILQWQKHEKNAHFQYFQSYMCKYPLQQHKHNHKGVFPIIPSIICVYTIYINTNINTDSCFQKSQSYMFIYTLQQHKHKHKYLFPEYLIIYVYTLSTTTKPYTQISVAIMTSITCINTFYNNTNINTKAHVQNSHSYMCTYLLQKHKHKLKCSFSKILSHTCVYTL